MHKILNIKTSNNGIYLIKASQGKIIEVKCHKVKSIKSNPGFEIQHESASLTHTRTCQNHSKRVFQNHVEVL